MLSTDDAIRQLRADPSNEQMVTDNYWESDIRAAAHRYSTSPEFAAVLALVGKDDLSGKCVVDVGSGNGVASYSFAAAGARVCGLDPNIDADFGSRAAMRVIPNRVVCGTGEAIPIKDGAVDIIFARQVLHHARDLKKFMQEVARVLRTEGTFVAVREHVVDDKRQLAAFLRMHPIHRLAGGEHAYPLQQYIAAMTSAGLRIEKVLGPWDTMINAYPTARTPEELENLPRTLLRRFLGPLAQSIAAMPGVERFLWWCLRRPRPGRLYTFVARKG